MQSGSEITDRVYSSLQESDLKKGIQNLAQDTGEISSKNEAILALEQAIKILKNQD